MKTAEKISLLLIAAAMLAVMAGQASAQPQQSANFRITKSVLDAGGAASSSANFRLVSAFGQPSPLGQQSSASFRLSGGFLTPAFVGSLSAIQNLVIHKSALSAVLNWGHITNATSYNVYRGTTSQFVPGPTNLIGSTSDTTYTDLNIINDPALMYFYDVTALNSAGLAIAPPVVAAKSEPVNEVKAISTTKTAATPQLRKASKSSATKR